MLKTVLALMTTLAVGWSAAAPAQLPDTILYGVAYYDEYTPVDRIDEDARLMKAAGITLVRVAESTRGTLEHQPGVIDFRHAHRMLTAILGARWHSHLCGADLARAPTPTCWS